MSIDINTAEGNKDYSYDVAENYVPLASHGLFCSHKEYKGLSFLLHIINLDRTKE